MEKSDFVPLPVYAPDPAMHREQGKGKKQEKSVAIIDKKGKNVVT